MKLRVYEYTKCGTCRKALKFLTHRGVAFEAIPIREQPPSRAELKTMLRIYNGQIRKLFNSSGQDYKKLNLKEKLSSLSEDDAIELLSTNGNLVKRPFVLTKTGGLVGFDEEQWQRMF